MAKHFSFLVAFFLSIIASGCNSDIFIDEVQLPYETTVDVEGDGGEWMMAIPTTSLRRLVVDYSENALEYVRYYDVNGNVTTAECPFSDLESIVYESPVAWYSIGVKGNMLYVNNYYNVLPFPIFKQIRLEYDQVWKYINVDFLNGTPLELISVRYDDNISVKDDVKQESYRRGLVNNSDLTQKLEIMPYIDSQSSEKIIPVDNWGYELVFDMPVLYYDGKEWLLRESKDVRIGSERIFSLRYLDEKIEVEVPPHKKVSVSYRLHYSEATDHGVITLKNPVTGRQDDLEFLCKSIYPTSYEISTSYE